MKLLILGGTADARNICQQLHHQLPKNTAGEPLWQLIYSVAGLVRMPVVDAQVISGGFTQFGGMQAYLKTQNIQGVIDATHPYANQIGAHAVAATQALHLPLWRFLRPPWQATEQDRWLQFPNRQALFAALAKHPRILLSLGQVSAVEIASLPTSAQIFLRTAAKPKLDLPVHVTWLKAIGPFTVEDERALFNNIQVDMIASKNSGGDATSAKLQVARERQIPVCMLQRPTPHKAMAKKTFVTIASLVNDLLAWLHSPTNPMPIRGAQ